MTLIDWFILFVYLIFSLVLGIYISLKNHNEADYFVAGRRLNGLLAGMSMAATCLLYTSAAADEGLGEDHGGLRIIKKKI